MSGRAATQAEQFAAIGDQGAHVVFRPKWLVRWWLAFLLALALLGLLLLSLIWLVYYGVGVWGNNNSVVWALDITGYDWWIGVATGAATISAWMTLAEPSWRGSLDRTAQTVGVIAVAGAGLYPIFHLGRPWFFYWNLPYPNQLDLWPQWRSTLAWDAVDIIGFLGTIACLWFVSMIPDLAVLRDSSKGWWPSRLYGVAALGWRGAALHWAHWRQARKVIAVLVVIMLFDLQAGAAVMYAGTVEPGWHDELLPVTLTIEALYAGIAMIALVSVFTRNLFAVPGLLTRRHLDILALMLLAAGLATTYCYMMTFFNDAYGGDIYDLMVMQRRGTGMYAWSFWIMVGCALLPYHLFWIGRLRRSGFVVALVALATLVGIYFDHFMLLVQTLYNDFLPSSAHVYMVSFWGVSMFLGTIGIFLALLLLSLRLLPVVSVTQLRDAVRSVGHD